MNRIAAFWIFGLILLSCAKEQQDGELPVSPTSPLYCNPKMEEEFVRQVGDTTWLWGGVEPYQHFDISGWTLRPCQLSFGLGREHFHALIDPEFETLFATAHSADSRALIIEGDSTAYVFPLNILTHYEAVNMIVDEHPVAVVYCVLADLAAVYTRTYYDHTFTFGVSGYTYHDNNVWEGLDGFVLWDRETESLWWPLIDEAVSGIMQHTRLEKHRASPWSIQNFAYIRSNYTEAQVLKSHQQRNFDPHPWHPRYDASIRD